MKLRKLTIAALAAFGITLALTPVSANAAETAPQTETTAAFTSTATLPPETVPATVSARAEDDYDYEAAIIFDKISQEFYTGDEPVLDLSKVTLKVAVRDPEGTYGVHLGSFRADGETLRNCFRIDMSELDLTKPGWQPVYVETIGGTYAEFESFARWPGDPYAGKLRVRFNSYRFARSVDVLQKSTELQFAVWDGIQSGGADINVPLEPQFSYFAVHLNNAWDSAITYTVGDPAVAEITEVQRTADQHNEWFKVIPHKLGDTTLTATADDGRTVTCTLHVIPSEDYYPPVETGTSTVVWSSAQTTATTAKTTVPEETTGVTGKTTSASDIVTAETTVTRDPSAYDYEGYIYAAQKNYTVTAGDTSYTGKLLACLEVTALLPDGSGKEFHVGSRLPLCCETYAGCYTYDLSEVDINTPGTYTVYVRTNAGVIDTFGDYRIKMVPHESTFTVTVEADISRPLFVTSGMIRGIVLGQRGNAVLGRTKDGDKIHYTCEPEGIIAIEEEDLCDDADYRYVYFDCLQEGVVTLTASLEDGTSTSCRFRVFATEEELKEYERQIEQTTVHSAYETTTTTTTATAAETTVTTESNLPQTGNNNYTALLTLLGALTLTGTGAWVLRRSKIHDEA